MYEANSLKNIINIVDTKLPRSVVFTKKEPIVTMGLMTTLNMNEPTRYQTIQVQESRNSKLIGILFAHPNAPISKAEIVEHLNHFHHRSGEAVDFFCVGYGTNWPDEDYSDQNNIVKIDGSDWTFSDKAFSKVIDELEAETKWTYSGETELLLVSAKKDIEGSTSLDYEAAIICNLELMLKDKAFSSVRSFFEGVFRFAKQNSEVDQTWGLSDQKGLQVGQSALKEAVLSLLPKNIKESYKKAEYYAIKNIS